MINTDGLGIDLIDRNFIDAKTVKENILNIYNKENHKTNEKEFCAITCGNLIVLSIEVLNKDMLLLRGIDATYTGKSVSAEEVVKILHIFSANFDIVRFQRHALPEKVAKSFGFLKSETEAQPSN